MAMAPLGAWKVGVGCTSGRCPTRATFRTPRVASCTSSDPSPLLCTSRTSAIPASSASNSFPPKPRRSTTATAEEWISRRALFTSPSSAAWSSPCTAPACAPSVTPLVSTTTFG
eukprot:2578845-Pyramimonas_sp.AAC.1